MTTRKLVRTAMMIALALVFQIGFRVFAQPMVGPLVNMTLIMTVLFVGVYPALLVGLITPVAALLVGIMNVPVLVPFIVVGNVMYVLIFGFSMSQLRFNYKELVSVVAAAVVKFAFLYTAIRTLVPMFMEKVPAKLVATFSFPQLYTAILGGFLAVVVWRIIGVYEQRES